MKTAEEILSKYRSIMYDSNVDECYGIYESDALTAMKEYADQFCIKPKCEDYDPEIGFPIEDGKCKNCGGYHSEKP